MEGKAGLYGRQLRTLWKVTQDFMEGNAGLYGR